MLNADVATNEVHEYSVDACEVCVCVCVRERERGNKCGHPTHSSNCADTYTEVLSKLSRMTNRVNGSLFPASKLLPCFL